MKNILVVLSVLLITLPFVVIFENLCGGRFITERDYFFLVAVHLVLFALYRKKKKEQLKDSV